MKSLNPIAFFIDGSGYTRGFALAATGFYIWIRYKWDGSYFGHEIFGRDGKLVVLEEE